jgi:DNA-binding GntR family transcriptional regulator
MDLTKVNTEHILLTDAIANRDVERAVALNREHRAHAIDNLTEALMQEQAESTS